MQRRLTRNRNCFVAASLLSVSCLVASFAYPLEKLTVYKQLEPGLLGQQRWDTYLITESATDYPVGFLKNKAVVVAQIKIDYKFQKMGMLLLSIAATCYALSIANETIKELELEQEVAGFEQTAKKEMLLSRMKFKHAMGMKEMGLEFIYQMKGIVGSYGEELPEAENMEADESVATDKQYLVLDMKNQGHSLEYAIETVYGLKQDTNEFKHVLRSYLED